MVKLNNEGEKQPPEVFYKKGDLKNFARFIRKHLCRSFFFNKVVDLRPQFLQDLYCEILRRAFLIMRRLKTTYIFLSLDKISRFYGHLF